MSRIGKHAISILIIRRRSNPILPYSRYDTTSVIGIVLKIFFLIAMPRRLFVSNALWRIRWEFRQSDGNGRSMVWLVEYGKRADLHLFRSIQSLVSFQDNRLVDGTENVPTDDLHMTQVDYQEHWLFILRDIVQPIQQKVYTGYFNDVRIRDSVDIELFSLLATQSDSQLRCSIHARTTIETSTSSRCLGLHVASCLEWRRQRLRGQSFLSIDPSNVSLSFRVVAVDSFGTIAR